MTGRTNAGGGVQLPALTNPAAAGNIQSGYQAINGEGEVVTGTAAVRETVSVSVYNKTNLLVYVLFPRANSLANNRTAPEGIVTTFDVLKNSLITIWQPNELDINVDADAEGVVTTLVSLNCLRTFRVGNVGMAFTVS